MSATATRTMRAVVLARPGAAHAREVPLPEPCDEEVLVRLEGCGVCVSSLPLWEGRPGFAYPAEPGAPGHEAWGIEVESGRRVALLSYRGYSEYEAVPASATVPLPPELGACRSRARRSGARSTSSRAAGSLAATPSAWSAPA